MVCLALLPKQPLLELSPLVLYSMLTPTTNTVPINITSPWLKPLVDYCSFLPSNMTHHMQLKVIKATIANLAILRRITWIVSATDANPEVESGNQMTSASPPCHIKYQSRNRRAFCIRMRQYGLLKCHRATTEAFSMTFSTSICRLFSGAD